MKREKETCDVCGEGGGGRLRKKREIPWKMRLVSQKPTKLIQKKKILTMQKSHSESLERSKKEKQTQDVQ